MQKQYSWPERHWNWPINISHQHGVRCGNMVWVGGQVNLTSEGVVLNPGNIVSQTGAVIDNIGGVLADLVCDLTDLVNLNCFYVNDGTQDEKVFIQEIAKGLPPGTCTAITIIPVPSLAYEGMLVEIEAVAMRAEDNSILPRSYAESGKKFLGSDKFCSAVRCEKMIFISAQSPVDEQGNVVRDTGIIEQTQLVVTRLKRVLSAFGAEFDDVVKINRWYEGSDGIDDFEPAALAFAANFTEPGPAATGIPLPRHANPDVLINIALIAMLGENGQRLPRQHAWPESLWDWHVHLPYKHGLKCGRMIFLGGQVSLDKRGRAVHPDDLGAQTHQSMAHIRTILKELGADYQDVCKVMAMYQGDCGEEALNANLPIRASYFKEPGPATTGVPLPKLAYEGMNIEIDIYAMADS